MTANFRIPAKHFYSISDAINGNNAGMYSILVAGSDIELYCKSHKYQLRHVLARIEKFRTYLESI